VLDNDDRVGFNRVETVTRDNGDKIVRTTTIESVHEGFEIHLVEETHYRVAQKKKAPPRVIGTGYYRVVTSPDGGTTYFPIQCPAIFR
jgi:hypothetical protein